jgi:hypothetical protein
MKTDVTLHNPLHESYVLQIDGRVKSSHRRFLDALRAGLQLKDQFPGHNIKVRAVQKALSYGTKLHAIGAH